MRRGAALGVMASAIGWQSVAGRRVRTETGGGGSGT